MTRYRIYSLQGAQLVGADEVDAPDDVQAIQAAREHGRGDSIEIWQGGRKVRSIAPRVVKPVRLP